MKLDSFVDLSVKILFHFYQTLSTITMVKGNSQVKSLFWISKNKTLIFYTWWLEMTRW